MSISTAPEAYRAQVLQTVLALGPRFRISLNVWMMVRAFQCYAVRGALIWSDLPIQISTTCMNKDLEKLYNRRDEDTKRSIAPRGTGERNTPIKVGAIGHERYLPNSNFFFFFTINRQFH